MDTIIHKVASIQDEDLHLARSLSTDLQGLSRQQARRFQALLASVQQSDNTYSAPLVLNSQTPQICRANSRPRNRKRRSRPKHRSRQHLEFKKSTQQLASSVLTEALKTEEDDNAPDQRTEGPDSSTTEAIDIVPRTFKIIAKDVPPRSTSGYPEVWADNRQELCEGLPYFRSYHGGIYLHDNVPQVATLSEQVLNIPGGSRLPIGWFWHY